jgi:Family of unknown function (DUF6152)
MDSRFSLRAAASLAALLGLLVVPAMAHHGWGGNADEEFEITGTVQQGVSLAGPHATMKIMADGHVWDLTLAPPARTQQAGLKEGTIPVGAKVTIHGHRNKDPKRYEIKTERVSWNGKTFDVYPDRK